MLDFLILALLLGIKHSFDADHLLAVSNLLIRSKSLRQTVKMGVSWALGHMITAVIITALLFAFRGSLSPILENFEMLVALMLILLGVVSLRQTTLHLHAHSHDGSKHKHLHDHDDRHMHKHMFGVGIIHGLASNDELLVLITATLGLSSFVGITLGIAIFSLGVIIGMTGYSMLLTYPLIKISRESMSNAVNGIAGVLSLAYGLLLLFGAL